jgi:hypothetical protein
VDLVEREIDEGLVRIEALLVSRGRPAGTARFDAALQLSIPSAAMVPPARTGHLTTDVVNRIPG